MNTNESIKWLEEHRSEYEANKDRKHLTEDDPKRPGWKITHSLDSDDPKYGEGYVTHFVKNYRHCLEILQQFNQSVEDVRIPYEKVEEEVNELFKK